MPLPKAHAVDGGNELLGVNCVSGSDCWGVGDYFNQISSKFQALTEHWDGVSWSIAPSPASTNHETLDDVSCVSSTDCWAVGDYLSAESIPRTLAEHWDGMSWSVVESPNTSASDSNVLSSVTCNSSSDCWAVGAAADLTLIEHWDGASWVIVNSANVSSVDYNLLEAVTCTSSTDCWAAGYYQVIAQSDDYRTLIEHWDGSSWSIVPSPNPDPGENLLHAVTCVSASQCWAAGEFYNNNGTGALFERWDGNSWTFVESPQADSSYYAFSVACASASDCWAAGSYGDDSAIAIEHWNGSSWSFVTTDNTEDWRSLSDVTCVSSSDCTAVGFYNEQALIEHWDGNSWAIVTTLPTLTGAVSRKTHGSAGTFDIDLMPPAPAIEPRSGGANGDHELVFTFANNLTSVPFVTADSSTLSNSFLGPNKNQWTADLTGVANAQRLTVTLSSNSDDPEDTVFASATMGVLAGDTTGDGTVNSSDVSQTKSCSGQAVEQNNFRSDVTVDGTLNSSDVSLVKSESGTALP